jgi:hypothetical protein
MNRTWNPCLLLAAAVALAVGLAPGCKRGKGSMPDGKPAPRETSAATTDPAPDTPSATDSGPGPQKTSGLETGSDDFLLPVLKPGSDDNSYCFVCHTNYQRERLAVYHEFAGVGCASCHGESDRHSADENGITPPDLMYPRGRIKTLCMKCHRVQRLVGLGPHRDALSLRPSAGHTCTECHGEHSLKVRTRQWDKLTGKLIADDGVRMVDTRPAATRPGS